ncbi:hypothetical protein [Microvirga calopogonii]|uniref:hypothetical protein n=1 Tax=Microvirga calopogonii TaxID=2078013 RepID=UPI001FE14BF2|nr:hypothetical protein [Microvirga calopogonii]
MARTSDNETGRASLPPDIQRALVQLDERVHAWNEADTAHDLDTRERLTEEIDARAETLFLAVLRRFGSEAVREHFGDDAPRLAGQGLVDNGPFPTALTQVGEAATVAQDIAWTEKRPSLQRVMVDTSSRDEEGFLVCVEGRLVAVLVRLDGEEHAEPELERKWFLEAGFGPCASGGPRSLVFESLGEAQRWAHTRVTSAARRR